MLTGREGINALPEISEVMVSYFQLLSEVVWEFHGVVHRTLFPQIIPRTRVMECLTGPPGLSPTLGDRKSSCCERTSRTTPHAAPVVPQVVMPNRGVRNRTSQLVPSSPGAPPWFSSFVSRWALQLQAQSGLFFAPVCF